MPRSTFWKDDISDLDKNFAEDVREYATLHGCTLGEATYCVCEQRRQNPEFSGLVKEASALAETLKLDPVEFARRSIRSHNSAALRHRLEEAGNNLREPEVQGLTETAEAYEFESSFSTDTAKARSLWNRAKELRQWIRDNWF